MLMTADADDVDTWMLDTLRLVSSEDVGHDEASVQTLVKKHKVTDCFCLLLSACFCLSTYVCCCLLFYLWFLFSFFVCFWLLFFFSRLHNTELCGI